MIKIGDYNNLHIDRIVDFGAYLVPSSKNKNPDKKEEVLLPARYLEPEMKVGDTVRVFVYTDSEDRPVATTETPYAKAGQFAFLQIVQINRVGAFLDWGLQKNLLVPFKEQKVKMFPGGIYLVYVYLDDSSKRVVASAKVEKFLGNVFPEYVRGEKVSALVIGHTGIGYQVIVDDMHRGMIYSNELYSPLDIGQTVTAFVKNVRREDGKIDLTMTAPGTLGRVDKIGAMIIEALGAGKLTVTDNSTPEEIKAAFHCSKKDFKKALGALYRERKIVIGDDTIELAHL